MDQYKVPKKGPDYGQLDFMTLGIRELRRREREQNRLHRQRVLDQENPFGPGGPFGHGGPVAGRHGNMEVDENSPPPDYSPPLGESPPLDETPPPKYTTSSAENAPAALKRNEQESNENALKDAPDYTPPTDYTTPSSDSTPPPSLESDEPEADEQGAPEQEEVIEVVDSSEDRSELPNEPPPRRDMAKLAQELVALADPTRNVPNVSRDSQIASRSPESMESDDSDDDDNIDLQRALLLSQHSSYNDVWQNHFVTKWSATESKDYRSKQLKSRSQQYVDSGELPEPANLDDVVDEALTRIEARNTVRQNPAPRPLMSEQFRRRHILSMFARGFDTEDAMRSVRRRLREYGQPPVRIREIEFWYERFRQGNRDLEDGIPIADLLPNVDAPPDEKEQRLNVARGEDANGNYQRMPEDPIPPKEEAASPAKEHVDSTVGSRSKEGNGGKKRKNSDENPPESSPTKKRRPDSSELHPIKEYIESTAGSRSKEENGGKKRKNSDENPSESSPTKKRRPDSSEPQ